MTVFARRLAPAAVVAAMLTAGPVSANPVSDIEFASRTSLSGNYLAGRIAGSQRDAGAAAAYFRAALQADPRNAELLERTFLLTVVEGDVDGAMRLADRVVASDPSNRMARLALAIRAMKSHNYASARQNLSHAAKGPLSDLTNRLIEAWAWQGSEQTTKAIEAVDKLQGQDFFGTFRDYHAALIADIGGRKDEAVRRFASALTGDAAALRIVNAAAVFKARNGDRDGALRLLSDFEKVAPRHPLMRDVRTALEQGREPRRVVADANDGAAEVLYGIGGALSRQGGEDLSLVYLQLALYLEPNHPMALVTIGDLYDQLNQFQDAIEAYARIPANSPLKRNSEIQSAMDLDRLDKTDEAKAHLDKLIDADPTDQEAIVALGNIQRGREQFKDAAETYTRAIKLAESPPPAPAEATAPAPAAAADKASDASSYIVKRGETLETIARDALSDGRRWQELAAYNRTPEAIKANGAKLPRSNVLQVGQKLQLPGKPAAAATAAAAPAPAEDKAPASALSVEAGKDAAKPDAAAAKAATDANNWTLYYVRGIAYERSDQWPKAEADLKKAMELSPDQPMVLNYLGYSWVDKGGNLDEGLKLIKRAVELKPDDGYYTDSLGWAYYKMGKMDDAVRELERAVELRPQDSVMNDHLGDAYWRVGRKLEARFQWSHARDLKPEPDEAPKIEAKLKDGLPEDKGTDSAEMKDKKEGG